MGGGGGYGWRTNFKNSDFWENAGIKIVPEKEYLFLIFHLFIDTFFKKNPNTNDPLMLNNIKLWIQFKEIRRTSHHGTEECNYPYIHPCPLKMK